MTFEQLVHDVDGLGLNMIDFALYTPQAGIRSHRFQPSSNCSNSYSLAKVFVMTALGMLWDEGKVNISTTVCSLLGSLTPKNADKAWPLVTLDHAMTHRVGFDEGFLDIDVENVCQYPTDDYLELAMSHPIAYLPGSHYHYSDAAYYILSRVVTAVTGEKLDEFLRKRLTAPMKFREIAWSRCPRGYPMGSTGLYAAASDIVKVGAMYLEGGVYQGRRYLSEDWVKLALANEYEFHLISPTGLMSKGGIYGQELVFSRERGFAASWHSFELESNGYTALIDLVDSITAFD